MLQAPLTMIEMALRDDAHNIFPLPLWSFSPPKALSSRRAQQRATFLRHVTVSANNCVSGLNFLHRSYAQEAASSPVFYPLPPLVATHNKQTARAFYPIYISAAQRRALDFVLHRTLELHGRLPSDGNSTASILNHHLHTSDTFQYGNFSVNKPHLPIVASQLSLPSMPGSVPLLSVLPPHLAEKYADVSSLLLPTSQVRPERPGSVFATDDQYSAVIQRLLNLDMLGFTDAPRAVNGLFAVSKDDGTQRLILDARPANALFQPPDKVVLPTPDLIANLATVSPAPIYAAKVDLDSYFHRFRLPEEYLPFFALPSIRAADVGLGDRYGADTMIFPCINRLPMGWSHSVLLAQSAHEHILDTDTTLRPADRISKSTDPFLDRVRHAVYVDDLILLSSDPHLLASLQDHYMQTVQRWGFPVKLSKVVRPVCTGVELLGLDFCGVSFTYGLRPDKLAAMVHFTWQFLSRPTVTGLEVASLVGKWTWAALVRRPVLSVLASVYRFINIAKKRPFVMWNSVQFELTILASLAPIMRVDLSTSFFRKAICTDSSSFALGVVSSSMSQQQQFIAAAAAGLEDSKGITPRQAEAIAQVSHSPWSVVASAAWRKPLAHINEGELRAVHTAVKWVVTQPAALNHRLLVFSDSTAVVGALSKGRSSSKLLLARIRPVSALLLAFGLKLSIVWLPSVFNPADSPSRLRKPPPCQVGNRALYQIN